MTTSLNDRVTQSEFGSLVGVSRQAIGDLVSRGILDPNDTGEQMLRAYCGHLREVAAGRLASGDLDLAAERAGLAKAQRERVEMLNAEKRRELAPVVLIEEVLTKAASRIAAIFDAIPGMVRRRVPKLSSADVDLIAGEIAKARNIVAGLSLADLDIEQEPAADADPVSAAE